MKKGGFLLASLVTGYLAMGNFSYAAQYLDDVNYQKAVSYLNSANYQLAIPELEKSLKLFPDNTDIKTKLVDAYYNSAINNGSDLNKALNDYRMAIYYLEYVSDALPSQAEKDKAQIIDSQIKSTMLKLQKGDNLDSRFKEARMLRGMGMFAQAIVEFSAASEQPNLAQKSYEALGDLMMANARPVSAARYYDECLKINSKNSGVHLKLARALHKMGKFDLAIQEYTVAMSDDTLADEVLPALEQLSLANISKNPYDVHSYVNLGNVYQKKGDYVNAVNYYKKAQELDPSNSTVLVSMGTMYQTQGDYAKALETYDNMLSGNPYNEVLRYNKAQALRGLKRPNEAIDELVIALRLDPNYEDAKILLLSIIDSDLTNQDSLDKLSKLVEANPADEVVRMVYANKLYKTSNDAKAIEQYQIIISKNPKNVDAYINQARLYERGKNYNDAITVLKAAIVSNPASSANLNKIIKEMTDQLDDANLDQALKAYESGDYKGALNLYLAEKTPDEGVLMNIAGCYYELQNYDKSIEYYQKVLLKNPRNDRALFYLGGNYYAKGDVNKALEYYNKALVLKPADVEIKKAVKIANQNKASDLLEKGLNLYSAGKYAETFNVLNQVIKLDSQNAYGYYYRALIYDEWKKYALAIEDYKKSLKFMPEMDIAYYGLGVDYDMIKDYANAKRNYAKYLQLNAGKNDTYTSYAKSRIKEITKILPKS